VKRGGGEGGRSEERRGERVENGRGGEVECREIERKEGGGGKWG